jgi:hypothetical protein
LFAAGQSFFLGTKQMAAPDSPTAPVRDPGTGITLSTGHFAWVRRIGTHAQNSRFTVHRVTFWVSPNAFTLHADALQTHDFITGWNSPHADPESRLTRILEHHVAIADRHLWKHQGQILDQEWSDQPDTHGNLAHPSMARLRVANL